MTMSYLIPDKIILIKDSDLGTQYEFLYLSSYKVFVSFTIKKDNICQYLRTIHIPIVLAVRRR